MQTVVHVSKPEFLTRFQRLFQWCGTSEGCFEERTNGSNSGNKFPSQAIRGFSPSKNTIFFLNEVLQSAITWLEFIKGSLRGTFSGI